MRSIVGSLCILPGHQKVSGHASKPFKFKLGKHIKHQVRTIQSVLPRVRNWRRSRVMGWEKPYGKTKKIKRGNHCPTMLRISQRITIILQGKYLSSNFKFFLDMLRIVG